MLTTECICLRSFFPPLSSLLRHLQQLRGCHLGHVTGSRRKNDTLTKAKVVTSSQQQATRRCTLSMCMSVDAVVGKPCACPLSPFARAWRRMRINEVTQRAVPVVCDTRGPSLSVIHRAFTTLRQILSN